MYEDVEDKNFYSALQEYIVFGEPEVVGTEDITDSSTQLKYDQIELIDFRKASFNQPTNNNPFKKDVSFLSLPKKLYYFFSQLIPSYMSYNVLPFSIPYLYNFRTPYDKFNLDCRHEFPENSINFDRQEIAYGE